MKRWEDWLFSVEFQNTFLTSITMNFSGFPSFFQLALLLHQELNSSPRVPRVPRMRQTTNAQFTTPSTTSVLSKRSYSGGRDQVSVSWFEIFFITN